MYSLLEINDLQTFVTELHIMASQPRLLCKHIAPHCFSATLFHDALHGYEKKISGYKFSKSFLNGKCFFFHLLFSFAVNQRQRNVLTTVVYASAI